MQPNEWNEILSKLIPQTVPDSIKIARKITGVHTSISNHFSHPEKRDRSHGEAAAILRNLMSVYHWLTLKFPFSKLVMLHIYLNFPNLTDLRSNFLLMDLDSEIPTHH